MCEPQRQQCLMGPSSLWCVHGRNPCGSHERCATGMAAGCGSASLCRWPDRGFQPTGRTVADGTASPSDLHALRDAGSGSAAPTRRVCSMTRPSVYPLGIPRAVPIGDCRQLSRALNSISPRNRNGFSRITNSYILSRVPSMIRRILAHGLSGAGDEVTRRGGGLSDLADPRHSFSHAHEGSYA